MCDCHTPAVRGWASSQVPPYLSCSCTSYHLCHTHQTPQVRSTLPDPLHDYTLCALVVYFCTCRPAVKKPRCEEGDTEEGVVRYKQTDPEDVLFRKPRSLVGLLSSDTTCRYIHVPASPTLLVQSAVRSHLRHSALSSQQRESKAHQSRQGAPHIPPPTPPKPPCAGGDDSYLVDTSTVSEVTSTCRVTSDKKVKSASAR